MYCRFCGKVIEDDSVYCRFCGKLLSADTLEKGGGAVSFINGHEAVDLGLSVKWATCNVGADKPSDYGDYFAWGEILTKEEYNKETYTLAKNKLDNIVRNLYNDAATALWGKQWRLPTRNEIDELLNKCQWRWVARRVHHSGYIVTGINGNSIFLPAAGYWRNKKVVHSEICGNYWCSEIDDNGWPSLLAFHYQDDRSNGHSLFFIDPAYGQSVRPVSE